MCLQGDVEDDPEFWDRLEADSARGTGSSAATAGFAASGGAQVCQHRAIDQLGKIRAAAMDHRHPFVWTIACTFACTVTRSIKRSAHVHAHCRKLHALMCISGMRLALQAFNDSARSSGGARPSGGPFGAEGQNSSGPLNSIGKPLKAPSSAAAAAGLSGPAAESCRDVGSIEGWQALAAQIMGEVGLGLRALG